MGVLNEPLTLWFCLAWPALPLVWDLFENNRYYPELMHITGTLSTQLLVLTLGITPLTLILKRWHLGQRTCIWFLKRRRYFGVAAFCYAFLHLVFYVRETSNLRIIYLEAFDVDFLFGWVGLLFLVLPFLTSNRFSTNILGKKWKPIQRLSYIAVFAIFLHWFYFDFFWDEVLMWVAILTSAKSLQIVLKYRLVTSDSSR